MHDHATIKLDTSLVAIFLNRCHLSFKQLLFENMSQLQMALSKYITTGNNINQTNLPLTKTDDTGGEYEYMHAPLNFEKWIQESATRIETSMTNTLPEQEIEQIKLLTRDATRSKNYHMTNLLTSLVHT